MACNWPNKLPASIVRPPLTAPQSVGPSHQFHSTPEWRMPRKIEYAMIRASTAKSRRSMPGDALRQTMRQVIAASGIAV